MIRHAGGCVASKHPVRYKAKYSMGPLANKLLMKWLKQYLKPCSLTISYHFWRVSNLWLHFDHYCPQLFRYFTYLFLFFKYHYLSQKKKKFLLLHVHQHKSMLNAFYSNAFKFWKSFLKPTKREGKKKDTGPSETEKVQRWRKVCILDTDLTKSSIKRLSSWSLNWGIHKAIRITAFSAHTKRKNRRKGIESLLINCLTLLRCEVLLSKLPTEWNLWW